MSDPAFSQLVAVESDLSQQVESLESELARIRERRSGLRTVIDMFEDADGEPVALSAKKTAAKKTATKKAPTAEDAKAPAKTSKATAAKKVDKKPARTKKKDGRAADWQKYVQSDYKDLPLPEAVSSVLRSAPSEIFTIADVMSSIFTESMPRTSYLKARNRISNILSAGARDGTWYRGRNGRYSQSQSVEKMK